MTKKLALLTIIPSLLWFLAINNGYSQCTPNNEVEEVAPLYFSYTYNIPLISEQMMLLEYWMVCDMFFENLKEDCCCLEDWMFNKAPVLVYHEKHLEDWMLSDSLNGQDNRYSEMLEWMFGFEPFVESALYSEDIAVGVEDWMLELNTMTRLLLLDSYTGIKDWMLSISFNEHESLLDLEDWMVSMN